MALRHTTYDPLAPGSGGLLMPATVGDALDDIRAHFLSLGSATRWQEVTDAAPTPEEIREYATSYTAGTNAGSMAAEDQQLTLFLKDDPGAELDSPRYRLLRISKFNSTTNSRRLIVMTREVPGDADWGASTTSSTNSSPLYLIYSSGSPRLQMIETENLLSLWATSEDGSSHESYVLVSYPGPPADGHVLRDTPDVGFIYNSSSTNQQNTSQSTTSLSSYITATRFGSGAYLFPAGGAHFGTSLDVQGRQMLVGVQVVRYMDPVYHLGLLDEALAISGATGGALATFQIEGRGYVKTVHQHTDVGVLSILLPYE